MRERHATTASRTCTAIALSLGLALGMTGCIAPPLSPEPSASSTPSSPEPSGTPSADPSPSATLPPGEPGTGGPNPDQPIDPDHPWPSDVPRPPGAIISESSAPNPIGEGSIWNVVFSVSSISDAENYVAQLRSSGWTHLDDRDYPVRGEGGSISWALSKGAYLAELSSSNTNASPVIVEFSILSF